MTAVHRAEPDRVPIDLLPNRWVEERLHRDLGTRTHRELLERLHCDVVDLRGVVDPVYRGAVPFSRAIGDGVHENFWGWRQRVVQSATGPEEQFAEFPLAGAATIDELARHRWPDPKWFDFTEFTVRLKPWRDFAVMASGASVFQHATFLRGFDTLLTDMALNPELAHWLMDRFTDFYVTHFDRMLGAAGGAIDILRIADDLGSQNSLFISPVMFREFVMPRVKRLVDMAHSHEVRVMFHSCGAIRPLIGDLVECGVDILDPLQASAAGMEPEALKRDCGDQLCLHGGICTQYLLPGGTPQEVCAETRRRIEILGEGGGYILAPCHVLQSDVPTENILALCAVQVILPDWFPVTEEEAVAFLDGMADAAGGIGMVLYNPPHAKRVWTPEQLGRLAGRVPALIGLKTAGGDDAWYAAMRAHLSRLSVFVPGHLLASGVTRGAAGSYSNVACLNPAAAQRWSDQMMTDLPAALEVEARLLRFMSGHIAPFITQQHYCNAACDRLMAVVGGWADVGWRMRWPYRSIPLSETGPVRAAAHRIIPEFV